VGCGAVKKVVDTQLSADDFAHYFAVKIDRICELTVSSPSSVINDRSVDQPLSDLRQ